MSRLETMSRFNEDIPEYTPVAVCVTCSKHLYKGESVLNFEQELFCDVHCLMEYMGISYELLGDV